MSSNGNVYFLFPKPGEVRLMEEPVPVPGPNQILTRTVCSMVSPGTEMTVFRGSFSRESAWGEYGAFPFRPGYNNIGRVVAVGDGVDKQWLDRKVATESPHAAFTVSSADEAKIIDRDVPDEQAAFFAFSEICMNGIRRGGVTWGENVAVYGLGLLGQLTVRICSLAGVQAVIGIDTDEFRLGKLPSCPQVAGINPRVGDVLREIERITQKRMIDAVFEVTGNPEVLPKEFSVLREQGRLVVLSSPSGPTALFDFHDLCNAPSFTIIGAHNSSHPAVETPGNPWTKQRHFELFLDFLMREEFNLKTLITHRVPFSEGPEIYRMLLEKREKTLGVVIHWE